MLMLSKLKIQTNIKLIYFGWLGHIQEYRLMCYDGGALGNAPQN